MTAPADGTRPPLTAPARDHRIPTPPTWPRRLDEALLDHAAAALVDLMPLARILDDAAPALGDELQPCPVALEPVGEAAVHAGHREPGGLSLARERRLEQREVKSRRWIDGLGALADQRMKVRLDAP